MGWDGMGETQPAEILLLHDRPGVTTNPTVDPFWWEDNIIWDGKMGGLVANPDPALIQWRERSQSRSSFYPPMGACSQSDGCCCPVYLPASLADWQRLRQQKEASSSLSWHSVKATDYVPRLSPKRPLQEVNQFNTNCQWKFIVSIKSTF